MEIPSSKSGKVPWLGADIGDTIAVGVDLIRIEIDGERDGSVEVPISTVDDLSQPTKKEIVEPVPIAAKPSQPKPPSCSPSSGPVRAEGEKSLALLSVRKRASEA